MPRISAEDQELASDAKKKAGDLKTLARLFGVSVSSVSEWGTSRPIPRHARGPLRAYVTGELVARADFLLLLDFTARVAGHKQLRRVIIALADDADEAKFFTRAMMRAEELEREGMP